MTFKVKLQGWLVYTRILWMCAGKYSGGAGGFRVTVATILYKSNLSLGIRLRSTSGAEAKLSMQDDRSPCTCLTVCTQSRAFEERNTRRLCRCACCYNNSTPPAGMLRRFTAPKSRSPTLIRRAKHKHGAGVYTHVCQHDLAAIPQKRSPRVWLYYIKWGPVL